MQTFYAGALGLLAAASVARADYDCDAFKLLLSAPLTEDTTHMLSSATVHCPILDDNTLEEFVIQGGTLTLTGSSTTKFTNMMFTVMDGARLIFDFDMTEFGPNVGYEQEDDFGGYMVKVESEGEVEFTGEMYATGLENMRSVFYNEGNIKFASHAVFHDCDSNVFLDNVGGLRFFGNVTFTENRFIAISNDGGIVRIDGTALFESNGQSFEGHNGGAFANYNGGIANFRGPATFSGNQCDESGGGVYNGPDSKMTFHRKVELHDNQSLNGKGGGLDNCGGLVRFKRAVSVLGNKAGVSGGGIATGIGGTTTFYGWTTIKSNKAEITGGAMSLYNLRDRTDGSTVTFRKPANVGINTNEKTGSVMGCNNIFVEDESSTLVGYKHEAECDICDAS